MQRFLIMFLMFCFLVPNNIEAKKKPFGKGFYWELTEDGVLTITGSGAIPRFNFSFSNNSEYRKTPWLKHLPYIHKVIVGEGITAISDNLFTAKLPKYSAIEEVVLPSTLEEIGKEVFRDCIKLKSIVIPNSVTKMGFGVFQGCTNLTSVTLSNRLTYIPSITFFESGLRSIKIPNSVEDIGNHAFAGCGNLKSVSIPNSLKKIRGNAFAQCYNLDLCIPLSVESIEDKAFGGAGVWPLFSGQILSMPPFVMADYERYGISKESAEAYNNGIHDNNGLLILSCQQGMKITQIKSKSNEYKYYIVEMGGKRGIFCNSNRWIVPMSNLLSNHKIIEMAGNDFMKIEDDGFYGILSTTGKIIIPTSRQYTSIGDYNSSNETFAFSKKGYTGLCNAQGQEISSSRVAPTIDDIKANGGYSSAAKMTNGGKIYYKVSKAGRYGLTDSEGNIIVPVEMEDLSSAGNGYLRYKVNGFVGLMTFAGKIIIDTDRGYTSIGNFVSFTKRFPYEMAGYKGECNQLGQQVSKIKVSTPQQSVASSSSSSNNNSSNNNNSSSSNSSSNSQTIVVQHQRQPQPVQVWITCQSCDGSGTCRICGGSGWTGVSHPSRCISCGGRGVCARCAGKGGHYEVQYR